MNRILYLSILIFLAGCNGDIFVEDFMPKEYDEITISETNNGKEINFKSDNWGLIGIACEASDRYNTYRYTIDGELTNLPFEVKELGSIRLKSDYLDVIVERKSGNKLKVILNENLMNENVRMLIEVGNSYKYQQIEVQLAPTQKYQIDNIVYDFKRLETNENGLKEMQVTTFENNSSSPITIGVLPYSKSTREVTFYDSSFLEEKLFANLLGIPLPDVIIPDVIDGKPVVRNSKAAFGIRQQYLPVDLDKDLSVDVTIDGYDKRKIIVYNLIRYYSVPYVIYLSNPKTGKELTFSGKLSSSEPIDYFVLKEKLNENE